jgi:hypothetical protein
MYDSAVTLWADVDIAIRGSADDGKVCAKQTVKSWWQVI